MNPLRRPSPRPGSNPDASPGGANGASSSSAPGVSPGGISAGTTPFGAAGVACSMGAPDPGVGGWPGASVWPGFTGWSGAGAGAMGLDTGAMPPGAASLLSMAMAAGMPSFPSSTMTSPTFASAPVRNAPTSQNADDNTVPVPQTGAKRRRGGRRPRKAPQPARTTPVIDLTDSSMADWCDENLRIVCEIFTEEVRIGNRSNTHLNKAGYQNVIKKFKDRTGLLYTRMQFKNRWDKLKLEYGIWKQLTRQTGLGWDESGKNIVMPEEWWKRMANAIKGSHRFKERGLQHEDQLAEMFEDLRNTGDDHWCPSSGVPPSQQIFDSGEENNDDEESGDNDEDSEPEEVTPPTGTAKRGWVADNSKGNKPKTATGHWFQEQVAQLVEMQERTTASCESIATREDISGYSIKDVMPLVKACGATVGIDEHFTATLIFTKRAEREMFMTLDTPKERFLWLKKKHEWMTRHDVP